MRIYIKEIRPEGTDISGEMPVEEIGLTKEDYLHFISPLSMKANVKIVEDVVLVRVDVTGRFESYCSRSLERIEDDFSTRFDLDFTIDRSTEYVDLDEDIRQEVIVRLPIRLLSKKEQRKEQQELEAMKSLK